MVDIVKAKAALDAKTVFVCGAIYALYIFHAAVLGAHRNLTAHATERADGFGLFVIVRPVADLRVIQHCGRHQCTGRAGLHAFTTGHARAFAHGVGQVESRVGVMATTRHADHVIDLHLTAGAHAQTTLDTRVEIDAHSDMAVVQ